MILHRIVLDTNVLVSARLFFGSPRKVWDEVLADHVICAVSERILNELRDVLLRAKFRHSEANVGAVIAEVRSVCQLVKPSSTPDVVQEDPSDNEILACAVEAGADFVISGDRHLLRLGQFEDIRIVSPADFLALLEAERP